VSSDTWTIAQAKAKFGALIERARIHGPQTIAHKGNLLVVVVSAKEWARKRRRVGNLADFFAASPLPAKQKEGAKRPSRTMLMNDAAVA